MHPVSDMPLNCLENCIDAENPKQFDDITAGDYLYERFRFRFNQKIILILLLVMKDIEFNNVFFLLIT
jgi:hypothetical protein